MTATTPAALAPDLEAALRSALEVSAGTGD